MRKIQLLVLILIISFNVALYSNETDDNLDDLLGQWYGIDHNLYEPNEIFVSDDTGG